MKGRCRDCYRISTRLHVRGSMWYCPRCNERREANTPKCLKCLVRAAKRPGGFCRPCYARVNRARQEPVQHVRTPTVPETGIVPAVAPTPALPGTAEKLAVLMSRAAGGQALWHWRDGVVSVDEEKRRSEMAVVGAEVA